MGVSYKADMSRCVRVERTRNHVVRVRLAGGKKVTLWAGPNEEASLTVAKRLRSAFPDCDIHAIRAPYAGVRSRFFLSRVRVR